MTQPDSDARALQRVPTWNVDAIHSQLFVTVRHMGVSNLRAKFPKISGTLQVNPDGETLDERLATLARLVELVEEINGEA